MGGTTDQTAGGILVVDSKQKAYELLLRLRQLPGPFGLDTETVGVDPGEESSVGRGRPVCWSLAWTDPALGTHGTRKTSLARRAFIWADFLEVFRHWLRDPAVEFVGDGILSFDGHILRNAGYALPHVKCDNLRLSRLLNSHSQSHDLKSFMERVLGYKPVGTYRELFRKRAKLEDEDHGEPRYKKRTVDGARLNALVGGCSSRIGSGWEVLDIRTWTQYNPTKLGTVYDYASLDAKGSLERYHYQRGIAERTPWHGLGQAKPWGNLWQYYGRIWHPFLQVLHDVERAGIRYDPGRIPGATDAARGTTQALLGRIRDAAGNGEFNPGSGPQLTEYLYGNLGLPVPPVCGGRTALKKTKPGKEPTSEAALLWLKANGHEPELVQAVLEWRREARQLQFLEKLPGHVSPHSGRIHSILQPEAATGRLTSKCPNLQQIPKRYDPYRIRSAFVPEPGHVFVVADYSQLEMVVLGHFLIALFGDRSIANDLETGDTHAATAARLGLSRAVAKEINYGINYGKSAMGLGLSLGVPTKQAQGMLDVHASGYPGIRRFQDYCFEQAKRTGKVHTLGGRFRPVPDARSDERWKRDAAFRQCANTPIQGSAADVVVSAMLKLCPLLGPLQSRMVLQVHDELIVEAPEDSAAEVLNLVTAVMENPFKPGFFKIPLRVDAKIATSWLEGH